MSLHPLRPESEKPTTPVGQDSPAAKNVPSTGGILPESILSWSGFIFLITFSWWNASFEEWSIKQQLVPKMAQQLIASLQFPTLEDEQAKQSFFEEHLNKLSLTELNALNTLADNHPATVNTWINETAVTSPNALPYFLKNLASPNGKKMVEHHESTAGVKEDIIEYDDDFRRMEIRNGISTKGFLYEIHSPYLDTIAPNVNVEIMMTNPKTGEARRMITTMERGMSDVTAFENLSSIERTIQTVQDNEYEKEISREFSAPYLSPADSEHFVKIYKQGNIYMTQEGPSLFRSQPRMLHPGTIPPHEVAQAQKLLRDEKLEDKDLPTVKVHTDANGNLSEVSCDIYDKSVKLENKNYLEITFNPQVPAKFSDLSYTTRIPYQIGETKGDLIERIGTDGSLARAMLMAASAFTRELVP